ncbi:MAG: CcmD family protein [Planctomycetales bacterium]|nr:CcmD family protein [Planctomycetales bacterium]
METFIAAYAAVWFAVVLYLGRLGMQQRRLQNQIDLIRRTESRASESPQSPR